MGVGERILRVVGLARKPPSETQPDTKFIASPISPAPSFSVIAGLPDVLSDTNKLRSDANYDNDFDIYDAMVKLDPELNGAVRSVSLTGNNYYIDYRSAKNNQIRNAIKDLVDGMDFDDLLINTMHDLMIYGNSISKLVGREGEGISRVQSLPIKQITITDDREPLEVGYSGVYATKSNPIMDARFYRFREQQVDMQTFPADEILHFKIDYRSNWYEDYLGRWTYGVWGASRFTSLKQAIRAKYNTINNRIALQDALTRQYIKIGKEAIEGIPDPDEAKDRLSYIMQQVGDLMENLRADQIPILPHYVDMHHVDMNNSLPDDTNFLDSINADISAVLNVPRVAAGQERGSTFAATFNANMWSVMSIERLQAVVIEGIQRLFMAHLELRGIPHTKRDLPKLKFNAVDQESPYLRMQRSVMGLGAGIISVNEARDICDLPPVDATKDKRLEPGGVSPNVGETPRPGEVPQDVKPRG
jgi:hypothetical protein